MYPFYSSMRSTSLWTESRILVRKITAVKSHITCTRAAHRRWMIIRRRLMALSLLFLLSLIIWQIQSVISRINTLFSTSFCPFLSCTLFEQTQGKPFNQGISIRFGVIYVYFISSRNFKSFAGTHHGINLWTKPDVNCYFWNNALFLMANRLL